MQKQEVFIPGPSGALEAIIQPIADAMRIGIICHPDPLQEGSMHNKVVTTIARAFNNMGITAIRFNYRGVGQSAGQYGDMAGEVDDCSSVVEWAQKQWPGTKLWLAGFSFGAYVAAANAAKFAAEQLISVAPSVVRMPYTSLPKITCPWLVIQGEDDEVVASDAVYSWFEGLDAQKTLVRYPKTGHFFHGKLVDLAHTIETKTLID